MPDTKRQALIRLREQLHEEAKRLGVKNIALANDNSKSSANRLHDMTANLTEININAKMIKLIDVLLIKEYNL